MSPRDMLSLIRTAATSTSCRGPESSEFRNVESLLLVCPQSSLPRFLVSSCVLWRKKSSALHSSLSPNFQPRPSAGKDCCHCCISTPVVRQSRPDPGSSPSPSERASRRTLRLCWRMKPQIGSSLTRASSREATGSHGFLEISQCQCNSLWKLSVNC